MNTKKYYLIYKITNNLNQKFYIGKHETNNLDDDYFGSGKHLNRAKEKYGLENFTKTILFYCHNREEMNLLEHCVVTPEFCQRKDVYNIMEGGDGGWNYVNLSSDYGAGTEKRYNAHIKQLNSMSEIDKENFKIAISNGIKAKILNMSKEQREEFKKKNSDRAKCGFSQSMKGKHHSKKTKEKISNSRQKNQLDGEKNGMHGKCWIRNPQTKEFKVWIKSNPLPVGWEYGKYQTLTDKVVRQLKQFSQATKGKKSIYNTKTHKRQFIEQNDPIPEGFILGNGKRTDEERKKISDTLKSQTTNNPEYIAKKIEFLRPRYQVYVDFGFEEMKKQFDYPYSLQNFSMTCKTYLPEYTKYAKEKGLKYKDLVSNLSSL